MKKNKLAEFFIGLLFICCIIFILSTSLYGAVRLRSRGEKGSVFWMSLSVLLPLMICWFSRQIYPRLKEWLCFHKAIRICLLVVFWSVLLLAAVGVRLWWISRVNPPLYSDFALYYQLADALASGRVLYSDYIALFPHVIGLPAVLSVLFRAMGSSVRAVQLFHIAVSVLTIIFTYFTAKNLMNAWCAKIAAVLLAFYPPSIFFCSLVATESLHLLLITCCVFIITLAIKTQSYRMRCVLFLLLGSMIALSNAIRPVSTLLLVALVFCIVFFMKKTKPNIKKVISLCSIMLISFIISGQAVGQVVEKAVHQPIAKNNMGYNLAVGTNSSSFGMWNVGDSALVSEIQQQSSAEQAHRYMKGLAFQRIWENPAGMLKLMIIKTFIVWSEDSAGLWYAEDGYQAANEAYPRKLFKQMDTVATYYFVFLLSMMAVGLFCLLKMPEYHHNVLLVVMILGAVAAFSILEAQSRYRFFLTTANSMLAAFACYLPPAGKQTEAMASYSNQ
jgi:hypothetical protein